MFRRCSGLIVSAAPSTCRWFTFLPLGHLEIGSSHPLATRNTHQSPIIRHVSCGAGTANNETIRPPSWPRILDPKSYSDVRNTSPPADSHLRQMGIGACLTRLPAWRNDRASVHHLATHTYTLTIEYSPAINSRSNIRLCGTSDRNNYANSVLRIRDVLA